MTKLYQKRFQELEKQMEPHLVIAVGAKLIGLSNSGISSATSKNITDDFLLNWIIKAKHLIASACGEKSQHFKAFQQAAEYSESDNSFSVFKRLFAIFAAAKEDYDGGYVSPLENIIRAEVFDTELEQASELLDAGYISAAAVITGIVLETTLRGLCDKNSISHGKLDKMNADLTKAGVHNVLIQKKITALAAIRNSAAHGKNDDFTKEDVESMIKDIKQYIEKQLN